MQKIVKSQAALAREGRGFYFYYDYFLNLYVKDQRKRDKRPTSKHNDGPTEFDYATKRDSRFAAYGGLVFHLAGVVSRWTLVQLLGHACI